jgi:hypothetical protein
MGELVGRRGDAPVTPVCQVYRAVVTTGVGKVVSGADWGGSDTPVMGG